MSTETTARPTLGGADDTSPIRITSAPYSRATLHAHDARTGALLAYVTPGRARGMRRAYTVRDARGLLPCRGPFSNHRNARPELERLAREVLASERGGKVA